jgi:hypothetical protein
MQDVAARRRSAQATVCVLLGRFEIPTKAAERHPEIRVNSSARFWHPSCIQLVHPIPLEAQMKNRAPLARLLVAAALALPAIAWAQFVSVSTPALSIGKPVVISTPLASGHLQTVSFVPPAGPMSQAAASRMIERAQNDLAGRGIHRPTALQIAVTLLGGALPTAMGEVQVPGLLPKAQGSKARQETPVQVYYAGPYV